MKLNVPNPALVRLCTVYRLLDKLVAEGVLRVSSTRIGRIIGAEAHTIRKDINYLGEIGEIGSGYDTVRLRDHIRYRLGLDKKRNSCVVGLGRLGSAILMYEPFSGSGYTIVAGFDSNINKLETAITSVPLFPAHEIVDVVREKNIELGILAVPASAAQEAADRLIEGGVRGIVNFSPAMFSYDSSKIYVTHIDIVRELTALSAYISLSFDNFKH
jgi:redox-sensing transcriptional repressor